MNNCPGNWHKGADAVLLNPIQATLNVLTNSSRSEIEIELAVA